jgi:TPR repeat protein
MAGNRVGARAGGSSAPAVLTAAVLVAVFSMMLFLCAGRAFARDPQWWQLPWDARMGVGWFRHKAEQGDVAAEAALGQIYERGIGTPVDRAKAARWYRKAARGGHAWAQFRLARMLQRGEGGKKDLTAAAHWYAKAADQGIGAAAFNLAVMVENGQGVPRNTREAARLYEKAYADGVARAALNRALIALSGPSPQKVAALSWLIRAEKAGVTEAVGLAASIEKDLTAEQRSTAAKKASRPVR